jgi:2-oxoglutarate ferredoxin oxidoreductase subunit beta
MSGIPPTWCPGCGDYGVLKALQTALAELNIDPKDVVVVSGIGCSSDLPGFVSTYGFHGLHGRTLPVATGIKLANPELKVIITGGDGDGYAIGAGHFLHTMRRNLDLTYIVMDNQVYGLTTGQTSPTSVKGHKTKSTPYGNPEPPFNPIAVAIVSGATYVARGFSGAINHLTELIRGGIEHKGFALIDVFSPCVTYNKLNTYNWFRERVYNLQEEGHDTSSMEEALAKALEWGDRIPIGLFYKVQRPTYEEEEPALKQGPLVRQPLGLKPDEIQQILKQFY